MYEVSLYPIAMLSNRDGNGMETEQDTTMKVKLTQSFHSILLQSRIFSLSLSDVLGKIEELGKFYIKDGNEEDSIVIAQQVSGRITTEF